MEDLTTRFGEAFALGDFAPEFEVFTFEFGVGQGLWVGGVLEGCVDVVSGFVGVVSLAGEIDDAAEESRFVNGGDAEGFEVAGAGGFDVEAALCGSGEGGVHREFIGAGVEGEFVASEVLGDGGVVVE